MSGVRRPDPARQGLDAALRPFLQDCGARRIVYVSCNPGTQVRQHCTAEAMQSCNGGICLVV